MDMNQQRILYEDQDIIVCHKPAGIATQTARIGQADMVSEVTNYLASAQKAPYVGVVHRLDQPVEGILVFARNQRAAADLSRQIAENRMEKYYYAVVCGRQFTARGELTDYLLKDARTNTSHIVVPEVKGAKKAVLEYEIQEEILPEEDSESESDVTETAAAAEADQTRLALVQIRLHTGRHHQIRVQMSNAGMSLLGDYKYADEETVRISEQMRVKGVALCACRLSFRHPQTGGRMDFKIKPEGKIFQRKDWFA